MQVKKGFAKPSTVPTTGAFSYAVLKAEQLEY